MKSTIQNPSSGQKEAGPGALHRFVILGLPRSGSTYLMTLLNAHREVFCSGEQFNPFAVVGIEEKDDSHEAVLARDTDPLSFMESFFDKARSRGVARAGFKFMIGHNIQILKKLAKDPEITIIHVWRDNRLAQVSSLIKASRSQKWAQTRPDGHIEQKIDANPRQISHRWHEYATFDYLAEQWLDALPNPKITLEYRELFQPGFNRRICEFLGVGHDPSMASPLVKQNSNTILDRFTQPRPIRYYFTRLGYARWLGNEL